jgi:hypothetical protein
MNVMTVTPVYQSETQPQKYPAFAGCSVGKGIFVLAAWISHFSVISEGFPLLSENSYDKIIYTIFIFNW